MDRIAKQTDGSYRWSCRVDPAAQRRDAETAGLILLIILVLVLTAGVVIAALTRSWDALWIPALVVAIVTAMSAPLLYLYGTAKEPRERYELTEHYVKSGYGRSAVYSVFSKVKTVAAASDHIVLFGKNKSHRIQVPKEDMEFVRDFILERVREESGRRPSGPERSGC